MPFFLTFKSVETVEKNVGMIYLNVVPRESAQGRHNQQVIYQDSAGRELVRKKRNKSKEDSISMRFTFIYDPRTGKYRTGLDEKIINPFPGTDFRPGSYWVEDWDNILKQDELSLQTYYEILDNMPKNAYTSVPAGPFVFTSVNSALASKQTQLNYLETFSIELHPNITNVFTTDTARGRLAIQMCKNHPLIAINKDVANPALHEYYIAEENESAIEKEKQEDLINEAIANLYVMQTKEPEIALYQLAVLCTDKYGRSIVRGEVSKATVKTSLNAFIKDEKYKVENIRRFNDLFELYSNKSEKKRFYIKYLIQQALNTQVMSVTEGYYTWHTKRSIPSVYKISTDPVKVENFFLNELNKYTPDSDETNWYDELVNELAFKGVKIDK